MGTTIDACGLNCPAPVLLVKDAVDREEGQDMTVLVDNEASRENVTRFLGSKGYQVTGEQDGAAFRLEARLTDGSQSDGAVEEKEMEAGRTEGQVKTLILVATDRFGSGDALLGEKLMVSYLKTLNEMADDLWQLIFLNSGVKLTTGSSPALEQLQEYERSGVIILACGTCLEHFGLTAEKQVGATTNMLDIVTAMQLADKVVTIG